MRRGAEAASADAGAAEADLRDAQVLVAAEVASTYLDLRGAQKRLEVARANLESQRETLSLTRVRLDLGRGSELDVASAAARLAATEASIPPLVAAEASAAHRLAVLLGQQPGTLDDELAPRELPPHLTTLAVGSPEELLRRRPDIRAAERELAAATARIGVAKADLFPRLTLTGFIGFIAGDASELGEAASRAWAVSPVLSWGGLEPGVRSQIVAAEARAQGALATYDRTVLRALEETESAFVGYAQNRARLAAVVDEAAAVAACRGSRARAVPRGRARLPATARRGAQRAPGRGRGRDSRDRSQHLGRHDLQGARRRLGSRAAPALLSVAAGTACSEQSDAPPRMGRRVVDVVACGRRRGGANGFAPRR